MQSKYWHRVAYSSTHAGKILVVYIQFISHEMLFYVIFLYSPHTIFRHTKTQTKPETVCAMCAIKAIILFLLLFLFQDQLFPISLSSHTQIYAVAPLSVCLPPFTAWITASYMSLFCPPFYAAVSRVLWANILTTKITAIAPGHATSTLREQQQSRL